MSLFRTKNIDAMLEVSEHDGLRKVLGRWIWC
jgi:APA family basic amino acid/polyamine antiporter